MHVNGSSLHVCMPPLLCDAQLSSPIVLHLTPLGLQSDLQNDREACQSCPYPSAHHSATGSWAEPLACSCIVFMHMVEHRSVTVWFPGVHYVGTRLVSSSCHVRLVLSRESFFAS